MIVCVQSGQFQVNIGDGSASKQWLIAQKYGSKQ
jgi:hypothetical protein